MGWLEKLKDFVSVKLKIENLSFISIHVNSHNTSTESKVELEEKEQRLVIYPNNLSNSEKKHFQKILLEAENEGELLFDEEKSGVLKNVVEYEDSGKDDSILEFYKNLISPLDFRALEEALFLRSEFKAKRQIGNLKMEITSKYGARGNNIANLCSTNYFEALIDIYNDHGLEVFNNVYNLLVGQELYAFFVHVGMNIGDIEEKIRRKINACKKYRIQAFRVHGIGKGNIKKINTAIKNLKKVKNLDFLHKQTITEAVITVEIIV